MAGVWRGVIAAGVLGGYGRRLEVVAVRNTLFGPQVGVAGLLPGRDVAAALRGRTGTVLLPDNCLDDGGVFIDGFTLARLRRELGREVVVLSAADAGELCEYFKAGKEPRNGYNLQ